MHMAPRGSKRGSRATEPASHGATRARERKGWSWPTSCLMTGCPKSAIRVRAYEIFLRRGGQGGTPESDWLLAREELIKEVGSAKARAGSGTGKAAAVETAPPPEPAAAPPETLGSQRPLEHRQSPRPLALEERHASSRLGVGLGACRRLRKCCALALARLGSVRRPLHPGAQVGVRPVAVHVEREDGNSLKPPADWSSRSPRTALFPDAPQVPGDHHCASAGHRLATTGRRQGSRVPIHSAKERFAVCGKTSGPAR